MKNWNKQYIIVASIINAFLIVLFALSFFFWDDILAEFNLNTNTFNFEFPIYLYALIFVLVLPFVFGWNWMLKRQRQSYFSHIEKKERHWLYQGGQILSVQLGFISLILALAHPQILLAESTSTQKNYDLYIAVDLSQSMDAMDDKKYSRLFYTKKAIERLVKQLDAQRVALIPFAGEAQVQVPISSDQGNLMHYLKYLNTKSTLSTPGSNIYTALELIKENISKEKNAQQAAIILFSDGEDHENQSIELSKILKEMNVPVFPVGVGGTKPQLIPIYRNGQIVDYKKDKSGNTVSTTINEPFLKEIAQNSGSFYSKINGYQWSPKPILKFLDENISSERKIANQDVYETQYQFFTLLALLLFSTHFIGMILWKS